MAMIKCLEEECTKMLSDKAEYCPVCGHPIASELKKRWEESAEGKAEAEAEQKREKRKLEEKEKREKKERQEKEEKELQKKLETFRELRNMFNDNNDE